MITYRTLAETDRETIYEAFAGAFADYVVDIRMTPAIFADMIERRGFLPGASMGAFDGEQLVGFILNGVRPWRGTLTCYDTGTGVLPSHRGRGLSKKMLGELAGVLRALDVQQYLLEVIQTNEPAYRIYLDAGFRVTRNFCCYLTSDKRGLALDAAGRLEETTDPDWDLYRSFWNHHPSWQNSIEAVRSKLDDFCILEVRDPETERTPLGYGIIHRTSGDIPQFAVAGDHRRCGHGRRLLAGLLERTGSDAAKVLNVEETDQATNGFLRTLGFDEPVAQYEMIKPL